MKPLWKVRWQTFNSLLRQRGRFIHRCSSDERFLHKVLGALLDALNFEETFYTHPQNKQCPEYKLDFDATMTVITGDDAKRRMAVIKRWRQLEQGSALPAHIAEAPNHADALEGWAKALRESEELELRRDELLLQQGELLLENGTLKVS